MPLNWDDDDEEELTEIEYRKRPKQRTVVHEEITTPLSEPYTPRVSPQTPPSRRLDKANAPLRSSPVTQPQIGLQPAPPRDRFVAFFIDSYFGLYLYWLSGYLLSSFFAAENIGILHANLGRMGIHLGITLLSFFFYYLLMESVFGATLGKFVTRLRVLETNGHPPSLGNVFIRNFLRIVDYPLAFIIAVISMESSPLNQRLGDRAANTIVIKKARRHLPAVDLQHTPLASTLSRLFAELIDLCFSLTLIYSLLLLMTPSAPFRMAFLYLTIPVAFLSYYSIPEMLFGTTPGKAIFRRLVVQDNGQAPDGTRAILRNLIRPLDYILGYPLLVISKKKQRLGDMAADTLVVAQSSGRKGLWGSLAVLLVVFLIGYMGMSNSNSIIKSQYGLNPLKAFGILLPTWQPGPKRPGKKPQAKKPQKRKASELPATTSEQLKLAEFYFATGPEPTQIRHDRNFRQGDLIFLFFKIEGFQLGDEKEASLSEDLKVDDPKAKSVLAKNQIVNISKQVEDPTKGILFANNIQLPKKSPKGKYRVIITVYDHVADTQFSFEKKFNLK